MKDGEEMDADAAWTLLEDHVQRVYFDRDNETDQCPQCARFGMTTSARMHTLMGWDVYSILARNEEQAPFPEEKTSGSTELWRERMAAYRQVWEKRKA